MGCAYSRVEEEAKAEPPQEGPPDSHTPSLSKELIEFTLEELAQATSDFSEEMVLGEGGFGRVYKGLLAEPYNGEVAVKRLKPDSVQGQDEWLQEIRVLAPLGHPRLVQLLGFCQQEGEGLLVYEYVPNGSLDYHLFRDLDFGLKPLSWEVRLRIAVHAAEGLAYLHEHNIIHRDFKAPNILLDEHFNAKVTDFGLAKVTDTDRTHDTTRIMGTLGYLDPEYMVTGHLTKQSDVYAFGVLLLELLSGRRAVDQQDSKAEPLAEWAQPFIQQAKPDINVLIDPDLRDQFTNKKNLKSAQIVAKVADHCISADHRQRPPMGEMVKMLEKCIKGEV